MASRNRAVVVIDEAAGKRIKQLALEEPYPRSDHVYLTVEFDDATEVLIELSCGLLFGVIHLDKDARGDLAPTSRRVHGSIQALEKRSKQIKDQQQKVVTEEPS
ncbi:hypothetical protein [Terriglobus roseus]|uniref:Uncharacterized protein n=1 Tax=Terriglobus roseus TaxID=392734 RepID=A0A1H4JDS0_9BACT|nr:hypothetical protein [Terriglobus roseus]SEB44450.1 hypothetical protein SAMN05443244_0553 [Terriglobus roseus]